MMTAMNITGAIMIGLILLGAILNAYGVNIPIQYITGLSIPILIITLIVVLIKRQSLR